MYYKITSLVALDDYILLLGFSNGEYKKFDLKPLMKKYPVFIDLVLFLSLIFILKKS